jgi:hypothetical protein
MVRSVIRAAVLLLAALALLAGCGGEDAPDEDPGSFAVTLLRQLDRGDAASAWEELHPLHQETVTRAQYVRCERGDPIQGDVTSVDVLDVKTEPARVPGRGSDETSTAVALRYRLKLPGRAAQANDLVVHLFAVDGRWAWVIGPSDYADYAAGRCPA